MNEWERLHKQAKQYKEMYPPGTRLELISMDDPYDSMPPGQKEPCSMWMTRLKSE